MTITPRFTIRQTDTHVVLRIRVPHVRVTAETIQVVLTDDDQVVHFSSPPYLLVLQFTPYQFHPTATEACATYEPMIENGTIDVSLRKAQSGVVWENLDLLGQWHKPSRRQQQQQQQSPGVRWLQQVVDEQHTSDNMNDDEHGHRDASTESDDAVVHRQDENGYGFLRLYRDIYADLSRDGLAQEMLELPWTEEDSNRVISNVVLSTTVSNDRVHVRRRRERLNMERTKFDPERYQQDLDVTDDYIHQCAMSYSPHWSTMQQQQRHENFSATTITTTLTSTDSGSSDPDTLTKEMSQLSLQTPSTGIQNFDFFTDDEQRQLMAIPYPLLPMITDVQAKRLLTGLVNLLFAYVYDHLTTCGDPTVESAWTISSLSASLSCLEDWLDDDTDPIMSSDHDDEADENLVQSVGYCCLRRCLVYPYLRNFELGVHCLNQVYLILSQGVRCVLRCLLHTRAILDHSELYYLGNKLWIDPYLAWLQRDTKRVESILQQQVQHWPSSPGGWSKGHPVLMDMNLIECELESQYMDDASSPSDDAEEEESDESDSSAADDSSSSSSSSSSSCKGNSDVHNDIERTEGGSESIPKEGLVHTSMASDLLDDSLGHSILNLSEVESSTVIPDCKPRRPLIEEVE